LQETLTALDEIRAQGGVATAGLIVIAPQGDLEFTRSENDRVAELARAAGGRFFAFGSVHPGDGDAAIAELERIAALGVRGLKLHPNTQHFDVAAPEVERVVQRAAELGLVILFDAYSPFDPGETGKFVKLALAHPTARFILAHMGGPRFFDMAVFSVLNAYPKVFQRNVWLDLSAVSHLVSGSPSLTEQLRHTCRLVGVDRILFGSDYPLVAPENAVADVHALGFDPVEERQIFHDNAAALFVPASEPASTEQ
jgi:predicted TIM-barrel fold metal-dependent hydrolase